MTTTTAPAATDSRHTAVGLARGGLANLVGAAFAALATFVFTALVARGLQAATAGAFFAATTVFGIGLAVAKLGTSTGLVYWLARLRAAGVSDPLRRCLRVATGPVMVGSLVVAGGIAVVAPLLTPTTEFATQVRLLAVVLPFAALSDTLLAATRGYRVMAPTVVVEKVIRPALALLLLVGALAVVGEGRLVGSSGVVATVAWSLPYVVTAVVASRWLSIVDRKARSRGGPTDPVTAADVPTRLAGPFWSFTAPRAGASLAQLALQRLDILLVAAFLDLPEAALYTVATRFVVVGQLANAAIGTAVEPRLAESLSRGDLVTARRLYQTATGWLVLLAWPLYLSVAVLAPWYLGLFGARYHTGEAVAVVLTLAFAMVVATGCGTVDVVLTMAGRTSWNLGNVLLALTVNIGLNLMLLDRIGIVGAGIAWAAAVLTKNLVPLTQLAVSLRLHPFGRGTALAAALATVCFGVVPAAAAGLMGATLPVIVGALALGGASYAAAVVRLRVPLAVDAVMDVRVRRTGATA